jgi:hypothetical protein
MQHRVGAHLLDGTQERVAVHDVGHDRLAPRLSTISRLPGLRTIPVT